MNFSLPKYTGLEHLILVILDAKKGEPMTISEVINELNSQRIQEMRGKKDKVSRGSVYGTIARMRGRQELSKVIVANKNQDLGVLLTQYGKEVLNNIKTHADIVTVHQRLIVA